NVDALCRIQSTSGKKCGITLIGYERNDTFCPQPQQWNVITTEKRFPGSGEFAGGNKLDGCRVGGKVEQRRLINPDVHKISACIIGAPLHRMMPNRLYELFEFSIRAGVVSGTIRRTQTIKAHLARCGAT